jgi:DNA-binding NarL/FixJ family response regulator
MNRTIRVVLADCHDGLCHVVERIINSQDHMHVVGVASSGEQAVRITREHQPDVALIDAELDDMTGAQAVRQLREARPNIRIIGFTMHPNPQLRQQLAQSGVDDVIEKGAEIETITNAIEAAVGDRDRDDDDAPCPS